MTVLLRLAGLCALSASLAGCGDFRPFGNRAAAVAPPAAIAPGPETLRPEARPGTFRPGAGARTAEAFDTTTEAQRVAAVAPPAVAGRALGTTIASLGDVTEPGFWLRTPLVTAVTQGRVTHAPTGASVRVELRPSGGAAGSGSQLSLPAFRALGLPLTDLPELAVHAD